jgi:hypothetical protein
MLADIAEHQPGDAIPGRSFDERHVSPGRGSKIDRVVITEPGQGDRRSRGVAGQLIPLLARYLACFAADADRRIGQKSKCRVRL